MYRASKPSAGGLALRLCHASLAYLSVLENPPPFYCDVFDLPLPGVAGAAFLFSSGALNEDYE